MRTWPVVKINYPLDLERWAPIPPQLAKEILGFPVTKKTVLFGAIEGTKDKRKGFDLLLNAIDVLRETYTEDDVELVVFGQTAPQRPNSIAYPIRYMGHLHDDISLRLLYSAADVMVVPSRLEAFGQTASEAQACGTPVVAFDNSGLNDIVINGKTGYLAKDLDYKDLSLAISKVISNPESLGLRYQSRLSAIDRFDSLKIAKEYIEVYKAAVGL
jgi:glycosyltransferase involved in cell wall biosynthesis